MFNITPRLVSIGLAGALVVVSAAAAIDGISNRATIRSLEAQRDVARDDLKVANQNIGSCHNNFRIVETAVVNQGKDIRKLADDSKASTDEARRLMAAATKSATAAADYAKATLARPLPVPAEACTESVRLLRGVQ
jgi:translation initiation factor 2B subunit (eIF-2B alpha/beta/delta family)